MRIRTIVYYFNLLIFILCSCSHKGSVKDIKNADNSILQQKDGTLSLIMDRAECFSDVANPSNNTAEWNIVISKPGRFSVWLTSATKDTTNLKYANSVRISLLDDRLEVTPVCDKILRNSTDVHYPYLRADSYMGSVYVSEPGEYSIQLISEKVIAEKSRSKKVNLDDETKLMSVMLTPITR